MKLSLTPSGIEQYRTATRNQIQMSPQKYCPTCKKRRSAMQFSGESTICNMCVRRAK